jgi:UDP-apiose/xylose synthase
VAGRSTRNGGARQVCLLGAGGFIGSHLVEWLLENSDVEVIGTDINHAKIRHLLDEPRFTYYNSDLQHDRELTQRLIDSSDVVVDLVAIANPLVYTKDPLHVFELDFLENLRVAQECATRGTRLIQFSTCEVYGPTWLSLVPEGLIPPEAMATADITMSEDTTSLISGPVTKTRWIYAASKHLLERAIHAYGLSSGLDYTIVRPFNWVGPRFDDLPTDRGDDSPRMFAHFMDALLHGTPISLVDGGRAQRTFIYIDDAAEAVGRMILDDTGRTSRQIFNIGNPANEINVEGFANIMLERYRERHWDGIAPLPELVDVTAREFFGEGYEDCDRRIPDVRKARELLDWEPRWSLDDLITSTMDAYVSEYRGRADQRPRLTAVRTAAEESAARH